MLRRGLTFDDVLLVPNYNDFRSRAAVTTIASLDRLTFKIPVIAANMDTICGAEMARKMWTLGGLGIIHRFMPIDQNVIEYKKAAEPIYWQHPMKPPGVVMYTDTPIIGVTVGVNEGLERAKALFDAGAWLFCVDVAHGHSKLTGKMVKVLREKFNQNIFIIAGNVATYAGADYLAGCGADAIKVGIGPGSVCTTRMKTGFGVPQITAIMDCSRSRRPIIADGGMRSPGDVVKALAAGANMVMLGGMLAGTAETPGDLWIENQDTPTERRFKIFRGMASEEAHNDYYGDLPDWKTSEGISIEVPVRGSVEEVIKDVIGGLRSGLTYCGASNISELQSRVEFIEVSNASYIEGTPHGKL